MKQELPRKYEVESENNGINAQTAERIGSLPNFWVSRKNEKYNNATLSVGHYQWCQHLSHCQQDL